MAAEKTFGNLVIKDRRLNINWGKSQAQMGPSGKDGTVDEDEEKANPPVPGLPGGKAV